MGPPEINWGQLGYLLECVLSLLQHEILMCEIFLSTFKCVLVATGLPWFQVYDRVGGVLVASWIHTVVSPPTELRATALVGDHGARIEHTPPARSCASAVCHWHQHPD